MQSYVANSSDLMLSYLVRIFTGDYFRDLPWNIGTLLDEKVLHLVDVNN